jgi:imidazolonepropionase-like amidohydrolase/murein DD-endopeptidase MepM/ murein hydrolase activator NlpD
MASEGPDWWVRAAAALATAQAAILLIVHARPGMLGVVLWFVTPPVVALTTAGLLAVGLRRTIRQHRVTVTHFAIYLLLGSVFVSVAAGRHYPSSYDSRPSEVRFRLPLAGPVTVAWGGERLRTNYHVVMPDQRWAYDLLVTREGRTHQGDGSRVDQYYAYGMPVLSPADGVVHAIRDGEPDEPPGSWRVRRVTGNHVVLRVAPGQYLFVAHLQPGSIRVAPGDEVRASQVLGLVGNSGNSTEPHVHLHLQDTPRSYFGEAIPFYFHDYRLGDRYVARGMPTGGQLNRRRIPRGPYIGQVVEHAGPRQQAALPLVIRHVRLIDGLGGPALEPAEIRIRDGTITYAGPPAAMPYPPDAPVIDGGGRTALPGLIDLHQHRVAVAEHPGQWLAHGVTTVRDPGGDPDTGRTLGHRVASGTVAAPRLFLGLTIDLDAGQTPDTVRARIAAEHERGVDLVKLYLRTPLEHARAAVAEARARDLPITWHLGPTLSEALDAGVDGVEHLYIFRELMPEPDEPPAESTAGAFRQIYERWARHLSPDHPDAQALFRRMAERGVIWTPTLTLAERIASGDTEYSAAWTQREQEIGAAGFASACAMVGAAHAHGVRIAAGTDTDGPADLHRELQLLVRCGLSPAAAIEAATRVAASALRQDGRLGVITAGAVADLVIVDGDPLARIEDTARVWTVAYDGRLVRNPKAQN